jgi:hypothetical protein
MLQLAEAGYVPGKTVNFIQKDAAGEMPNTTLVMKLFAGDQVDKVLAVVTPPGGGGNIAPTWSAGSAPTRWERVWIWSVR